MHANSHSANEARCGKGSSFSSPMGPLPAESLNPLSFPALCPMKTSSESSVASDTPAFTESPRLRALLTGISESAVYGGFQLSSPGSGPGSCLPAHLPPGHAEHTALLPTACSEAPASRVQPLQLRAPGDSSPFLTQVPIRAHLSTRLKMSFQGERGLPAHVLTYSSGPRAIGHLA